MKLRLFSILLLVTVHCAPNTVFGVAYPPVIQLQSELAITGYVGSGYALSAIATSAVGTMVTLWSTNSPADQSAAAVSNSTIVTNTWSWTATSVGVESLTWHAEADGLSSNVTVTLYIQNPVWPYWSWPTGDVHYASWSWTYQTNALSAYRNRIRMTSDGLHVVAVGRNSGALPGLKPCVSSDGGLTWGTAGVRSSAPFGWMDIAIAENGKVVAVTSPGGNLPLMISDDFGLSWVGVTNTGMNSIFSAAISTSGTNIALGFGCSWNIAIKISQNGGQSWSGLSDDAGVNQSSYITSLAMSSDGKRLLAGTSTNNGIGQICSLQLSTDYGKHWSEIGELPNKNWTDVAMSGDGRIILAAAYYNGLYISSDYGLTWNGPMIGALDWSSVAMSCNGQSMIAGCSGAVFTSPDGGASWAGTFMTNPVTASVTSVAMSSNGAYTVVGSGYPGTQIKVWTGVFQ